MEAIRAEKAFLESALRAEVSGFSLHSTGRLMMLCGDKLSDIRSDLLTAGFRYNRNLLLRKGNLKAVSDSNRYWRDGCLCLHVGVKPRILALVHPFWWDEEDLPVITLVEKAIRGDVL